MPATSITISPIGNADVVNPFLEGNNILISGTIDPVENETITVTVNSVEYTFTVGTDTVDPSAPGGDVWSVSVPTSELELDTTVEATALEVNATRPYTVDATPPLPGTPTLDEVWYEEPRIEGVTAPANVAVSYASGSVGASLGLEYNLNGGGWVAFTGAGAWGGGVDLDIPTDADNVLEIRAVNEAGNSEVLTVPIAIANPMKVTSSTTTENTATIVIDHWTLASSSEDYTYMYYPTAGGDGVSGVFNDSPLVITGLTAGTEYLIELQIPNPDRETGPEPVEYSFTTQAATAVPTISIDVVAGDDVVSAAESSEAVAVTGTVTDAVEGDVVTVTVGAETYTTAVDPNNSTWETSVPGAVLAGATQVEVSVTAAGGTATDTRGYTVDVDAPAPTISLGSFLPDNTLTFDGAEINHTISGDVGGDVVDGDTVTVTVGLETYTSPVTMSGGTGTWSVDVPGYVLKSVTEVSATINTTDTAGNPGSATAQHTYIVDLTPPLPVEPILQDFTINYPTTPEATADLEIMAFHGSGTVGDSKVLNYRIDGGDWVTIDVETTVLINVDTDTMHTLELRSSNEAGDGPVVSRDFIITNPPVIDLMEVDDSSVNVTFSHINLGTSTYEYAVFIDGGIRIDGTTTDATFTVAGLDDGTTYQLEIKEVQAEPVPATTQSFTTDVYIFIPPTITIDPITGDDVVDADEVTGPITVTGHVTGSYSDGDALVVTVDGTTYPTTVDAAGLWAVVIDGSIISSVDQISATFTPTDGTDVTEVHTYLVDGECSEHLPEGWPESRKDLRCAIIDYTKAMDPEKTVTAQEGNRHQAALSESLIEYVFDTDYETFEGNYEYLLNAVAAGREGVFNEKYVFRFLHGKGFTARERRRFVTLMTLMTLSVDRGALYAAKKINLYDLDNRMYTDTMKQNLQEYYK